MAALPQSVQVQGVNVQKKSTAILEIVTLTSPDGSYDSLYLSNYATIRLKDEIARLPGVGNVNVFGAGQYSMRVWLDPEKMQARGLTTQDVIQALQQQSEQVTAGQVGAPPAPDGPVVPVHDRRVGRLDDPEQFANVIVKTGNSGEMTRVRDVGRVELGAQTYGQFFNLDGKPAAGLAIFQSPGANALDVAEAGRRQDGGAGASEFPQGMAYCDPVRHHDLRQPGDRRGLQDADRGGAAGADRHPGLPAGLAGDAGAGDDRAGDDHRRLRGDGRAGLLGQSVDAVRHRAGHRHRRRRRHRRGRGRRPQYRDGHVRPRRGDRRDERAVRADHRHHAGADGGVPAGGVPARPHRPDVRAVRAGDRGDGADQRDQRRDAEADAVRDVAAAPGAAGAAQFLLSRLQRGLPAAGERLCRADRLDGAPQRRDGRSSRWRSSRRPATACRGWRPASCRSRTRAICSPPCSCRTAPRSAAPRRRCSRSPKIAKADAGRRPGHHHRRRLGARQQRDARQCRRRLHHAEGLERARQGRGPAVALHDAQREAWRRSRRRACWCCRRRRSRASATPPASPCRSSCATAASTSPSCRARSTRW